MVTNVIDRLVEATNGLIVSAIGATAGGILWMIRRLLTNQKQIELLEAAIHSRDDQRQEDREVLMDIKKDVKEVRKEMIDARLKLAAISKEMD